ncbi:hypothetical protein B7R76_00155 [Mageeibacillus indolicus]|uniref:Probable multidrug resistance protein NorM n=1 Tax=Mageeibacillus indolicus TaxID=884684 RepID=A0A2J8B3I6_9FIRM|nr:MATE family efflux transporter [Mageeibacillus indolicus]PNH19341.1 hypothetical protein B7R76_00155 [Mageeibacillus indolicus]
METSSPLTKKSLNLLQGDIISTLTRLALPIMASALIQMAYNLVDTAWIGRLGYRSVAAVGAAGMFIWFGDGLLLLSRIGGQVYLGQNLGRGDFAAAQKTVRAALQLTACISLTYTILQFVFTPRLVAFFHFTEASTIQQAETYLRLVGLGYFFSFTTRVYTSLVTVDGRSKISMYATIIGLLLNFVLDPLCIFTFGWGAAGAAIATVFSQAVVFICFLWATRNEKLFRKLRILTCPDFREWRKILRLGLPPALQTMLYSSIAMVLARMITEFGDSAISIQKVGSQIESLSWMTAEGFGVALTAFIAQNFGAGQWKRTKQGFNKACLIMTCLGFVTTSILIGLPQYIFQIFITDPQVIPGGISYLRILGLSQFFMCLEIITAAAFAGVGQTALCSFIVVILTGARIPLAYYLIHTSLGVNGVWWAISLSSIAKGIILTVLFKIYETKLICSRQSEI